MFRNRWPSTCDSRSDKNIRIWWFSLGRSRKRMRPQCPYNDTKLVSTKGNAFYRMILQQLSKLQQVRVFEKPQASDLLTVTKVLKEIYFNQLTSQWRLLMNLLPWSHSKRISLKVSCGSYYWWDWMQIQLDSDRMPVFCSFSGNSIFYRPILSSAAYVNG